MPDQSVLVIEDNPAMSVSNQRKWDTLGPERLEDLPFCNFKFIYRYFDAA
jgi:hypothetical protein